MSQSPIPIKSGSIYILHGWTYSLDKWQPFISVLKNKKLNPVLLKIPGLTSKIDRPWDIDDYVNWLFKKLEKDLPAGRQEKILLIGHSNGGRIAMAFSIKYPGKVSELVLIDSAGIYHDELYIKLKRRIFGAIAKIGRKLARAGIARDFLYFLTGERDYKEASENMKKTMINLLQFDKTLKAEDVSVPTIIIWGKNDRITSLSDGKMLNQKIRNSKLFIIDNSGHSPQFTYPLKVANIILNKKH